MSSRSLASHLLAPFAKLRALLGIALQLLRHERIRTTLAVVGVALAVLASVLLISVGLGVVETGERMFDQSGRDFWITGGPIELQPGAVGGFQNSIVGAHDLAAEIEGHEAINTAVPMSFQVVYASKNGSDYQTVVGSGAPAHGPSVTITEGRGTQRGDPHYANGSYDGPMHHEVVLDRRAAELLDVEVNDTVHLGGTLSAARENEFRVVGISPTYSVFVGAPTATMPLSELQEITGTTAGDRATFITIRLEEGANVTQVERYLTDAYPEYEVRTNREQLQTTLENRAVLLVSGASLIVLGALAGTLLLLNLQLSFVARYRETFAAVMAMGTSRRSLATVVLAHTLWIGILGGLLGILLAIPGAEVLDIVAEELTGFSDVTTLSTPILLVGLGVAVAMSVLGGLLATLLLARVRPLEELR